MNDRKTYKMTRRFIQKVRHTRPGSLGRHTVLYGVVGAIIGVIIRHPVNTLVLWIEFQDLLRQNHDGIVNFAAARLRQAPILHLVAMNSIFAVLGSIIGIAYAVLANSLAVQVKRTEGLLEDLQRSLPDVIRGGENEATEFKSTLRWDLQETRVNKALEGVIAKTVAGLMNHEGGRLLIGVADDGEIVGIEADLNTIRHKNQDGFERAFVSILKTNLGAVAATFVRCRFLVVDQKTICWVLVEKSTDPVFLSASNTAKYYVRVGNSTRELNAAEAHEHIQRRNG